MPARYFVALKKARYACTIQKDTIRVTSVKMKVKLLNDSDESDPFLKFFA